MSKFFQSPYFTPISLEGMYNKCTNQLTEEDCSEVVVSYKKHLLTGNQSLWGIPFTLGRGYESDDTNSNIVLVNNEQVKITFPQPIIANYLVFLHAADPKPADKTVDGLFATPMMGEPRLGETVCEYRMEYADGTTHQTDIRRRFQINDYMQRWGEGGFECVQHGMPETIRTVTEDNNRGKVSEKLNGDWGIAGFTHYRLTPPGGLGNPLVHSIYAWENPNPDKMLVSLTIVPRDGILFLFGISASSVQSNPLRWETRKKLKLRLPTEYEYEPNEYRDFDDIELDMGRIISVLPAIQYDHEHWQENYFHQQPKMLEREFTIEYAAHPDACLYMGKQGSERRIPLSGLAGEAEFTSIEPQQIPVKLKVIDKQTGHPVAVKIHMHGEHGEYLVPINHHRIPNPFWFEDYAVDYVLGNHWATYIHGEAHYKLPKGVIYVEVTRGFEIRPLRTSYVIDPTTDCITIVLERVLPWKNKGWVTADTHVHFLSPQTSLYEGAAEDVNVINLLTSQWGELFTNLGDFDGKTTFGSIEAGGTGEYLVRVGTENRQQILGHISLIGYEGPMIVPLTTGGPNESAIGDPVEATLTEWAMQCKEQNGLVILPHLPHPRAEGAAAIVLDQIDGVEMYLTDNNLAIHPYSLSDWYRYLNCGYHLPAVGGTDKMSTARAIGVLRTYSLIKDAPFTFDSWMESIRKGNTFATYGPLLEFYVDGKEAGSKIQMSHNGGTVDVTWEVASVITPVTRIEVVVNGETRDSVSVDPTQTRYAGHTSVKIYGSSWVALRVRGRYPGQSEIIAAHSSSVMIIVDGKPCFRAADALTILDQIEGSTAYLRTLGTKADHQKHQKMLMTLTSAHRTLHNRMHQHGVDHKHTVVDDHHHQ